MLRREVGRARQMLGAREDGVLTYRLRLAVPPRIRMGAPTLRIDKQDIEFDIRTMDSVQIAR